MRKVFPVLAAYIGGAQASTHAYYKDEGCMEALTEWKQADKTKVKLSSYYAPFAVGVCHDFGDSPLEVESTPDGGSKTKMKYQYTYGVTCSEYGGAVYHLLGKDHKDCIVDATKTGDGAVRSQRGGTASYCYLSNPQTCDKAGDADCIYVKIDCNPNNASVAGIILGSVALALSLAAVGLAAMASGKKGGGAQPAKPAAPAAPREDGNVTGSQGAAQAVGAATEA